MNPFMTFVVPVNTKKLIWFYYCADCGQESPESFGSEEDLPARCACGSDDIETRYCDAQEAL